MAEGAPAIYMITLGHVLIIHVHIELTENVWHFQTFSHTCSMQVIESHPQELQWWHRSVHTQTFTADRAWAETIIHLCKMCYQHVHSDEENVNNNTFTVTTYLFLYLSESAFQKSISSSFEENFGIISVSMANKSFDKRETGSRKSQVSYKVCGPLPDWKGIDF